MTIKEWGLTPRYGHIVLGIGLVMDLPCALASGLLASGFHHKEAISGEGVRNQGRKIALLGHPKNKDCLKTRI